MKATAETAAETFAERCYANEGLAALVDLVRSKDIRILDVGAGANASG